MYQIVLFDEDGAARQHCEMDCADDDEVLERVGEVDCPHEILVWDGERLVGRFPPKSEREFGS